MREVPPTAGLPLHWRDFLPRRGDALAVGLARFLRLERVQIECSGTAALVIALTTLARKSARRSVIVPAYTCPLVALAVLHCGLRPVLCDLRADHFDLCPERLRELCDDDTLAVMPTHLGGRVADVDSAIDCARRVGAFVVEDAAQALGARRGGEPVGIAGDVGFYSLAVGKGLTLYEGGVLIAREANLRRELRETSARLIESHLGWESLRCAQLLGYFALYRPRMLRFAYGARLRRALKRGALIEAVGDNFSAAIPLHRVSEARQAIGAAALARLPAFLAALRAQALRRKAALGAAGIKVMDDAAPDEGTWPYFMILMPSERARDAALARLWPAGVGVSRLFVHALPDYPYLAPLREAARVERARDFAARLLTVSNSPWMTDGKCEEISATLRSCARSQS